MKKKFHAPLDCIIESTCMFLHEFDGREYSFTADPGEAWPFTFISAQIRLALVKRTHPKARVRSRREAMSEYNLRSVGQSAGTGQ